MTGLSPDDIALWQGAVGRQSVETQRLDPVALTRYARAVGAVDETAPPLAHWAFFLPCPRDAEIGEDGHPRRGDFLPAVTLPRRMFAASSMQFPAPLEIGAEAQQTSTIAAVTHKSGRTGDLVFVEVDRVVAQDGVERVRERQTYVYRGEGAPLALPKPLTPAPVGEAWEPDEVNLFRFSAATFNGHRIHYDRPYTTEVEGYPALIVHGPFSAAKLADLAMRSGSLSHFAFRAQAPLFLGQRIALRAAGGGQYEAIRCDGTVAMTATATWR